MASYKTILKNLGLNDSEIAIYLTCLQTGPAQPQELVKKSGFSRPATYLAIEQLTVKGLLSSASHGKRKIYAAEPPERLVHYGKTKVNDLNQNVEDLENQIQALKLMERGDKPVAKYFEGIDGLRSILQDLADTKPAFTEEITNVDVVRKVFQNKDLESVQTKLEKMKTPGRALFSGDVKYVRKGVEARLLPKNEFNFEGDILLYADKIAMVSFTDKVIGVVIESPIIAQTYHTIFELAWRGAKTYKTIK